MHRRNRVSWSAALAALVALALLLAAGVANAQGRPTQAMVDRTQAELSRELGKVAEGLEVGLKKDDVAVAETLYSIEMRSLRLLEQASRTRYARPEKRADVLANIRGLINRTLNLQERVLDHAVAELDRTLPGEPGRELRPRLGRDFYRPLFRTDTPSENRSGRSTPARQRQVLRQMRQEFVDKGGKKEDIRSLDRALLADAGSGELYEWVTTDAGIRLSSHPAAKHPLIADGKAVRGAGSMKIFKGKGGEVLLVVVSNSSGNYKPGIGTTESVVQQLGELGLRAGQVVTTRAQPAEPTLVKLILKSKNKYSKEQINARVGQLMSRVNGDRAAARSAPKVPKVRQALQQPARAERTQASRNRSARAATAPRTKPAAGRARPVRSAR